MSAEKKEKNLQTKLLETWATLDFRAEKWGLERIAFDAIQNHFPEDCGGSKYYILFEQEGRQVDFRIYNQAKPVDKIYFWDDGTGYDYLYTVLRHSNKKDRQTQTGKFGEGLKMISAAALRNDVKILFRSQDWSATPQVRKIEVGKENKKLEVLCQAITIGHSYREGSYTLIENPSSEMINQVSSFQERISDFRYDLASAKIEGIHPIHKVFRPRQEFNGELFIKKIKYPAPEPLYLSYQINGEIADALLSPDRDKVLTYNLDIALSHIIVKFSQIKFIRDLLDVSTPDCNEKTIHYSENTKVSHPRLWKQAFHELYGSKAILEEMNKGNVNLDAENHGYKVVKGISSGLKNILISAGVKKASEVLNYRPSYDLVPIEDLTPEQKEIYRQYVKVNERLFGQHFNPDLHLFSRAYDENGEISWFSGMSYYGKDKSEIYLSVSLLEDPRKHIDAEGLQHLEKIMAEISIPDQERFLKEVAFLGTYAHEATHIHTKAVDGDIRFENGLTNELGLNLALSFRKEK